MEKNIESNKLPVYISVSHVFSTLSVDFLELHAMFEDEDRKLRGDIHDFPELLYIRQGHHRVLLDGVPYDLSAGQLIIYAPNVYHVGDGVSSAKGEIISFDTNAPEMHRYYNRVITPGQNQKRMLLRIFALSRGLYNNAPPSSGQRWMIPCDRAEVRDLQKLKNLMELFLLDLYQDLPETKTAPSHAINHLRHQESELDLLIRDMHANIQNPLSLSQLSQNCSMSVDKIKRLFRQHCGCGPMAYFTALKIDTAKKLIEESTLNFTQISEHLGFHSIGYFSRLFKAKTGMTPSEYARSIKNKP